MNKRRKILLIVIAGAIALFAFLLNGLRHGSTDLAARQKLDQALGPEGSLENNAEASPFTPDRPANPPAEDPLDNQLATAPPGFMGLPIPNPMSMSPGVPDSGVDVQEYPGEYVVRIPLTTAADAHNVKVNVTPHHIELSGKIGRREQGVSFTSSFVQSFSTSQTVLPEKMTQKTIKNGDKLELVVTIPKQHTGQANASPLPPPAPEAPAAPKPPEEIIPDNNDTAPSSDPGHRVI